MIAIMIYSDNDSDATRMQSDEDSDEDFDEDEEAADLASGNKSTSRSALNILIQFLSYDDVHEYFYA